MAVLGINDAHDSGAAVVGNSTFSSAANEERFTGRKNEVGFPLYSARWVMASDGREIDAVALSWIGGNALAGRLFPSWLEQRRKIWRRELKPSMASIKFSNLLYRIIQAQKPRFLWKALGESISVPITKGRLPRVKPGLEKKKVYMVEHHLAHAASAYYPSGFKEALIITLDGAGDGISGTVSLGDNGNIARLAEFSANASLGIMYGAATYACDMRYSEDEGKLMSLAAYSYPRNDRPSGMPHYNTSTKLLESDNKTRNELLFSQLLRDRVLAKVDRESFAYMMQMHLESEVLKIVRQWVNETGIRNVALSGGLFSNIKANMLIEQMSEIKDLFVFPHMGDGGLSLGAAAYIDFVLNGKFAKKRMEHAYLGPSYTDSQIESSAKAHAAASKELEYERVSDPAKYAAEMICKRKEMALWFQGGMEYGPRALGNRSVIALPDHPENRNRINLAIKMRPYYQPFACTILEEDAPMLLSDYVMPNRFMTAANTVRDELWHKMEAASHVDHTTRPQILGNENPLYRQLITEIAKTTGVGAVLNTSLNKHGKPIAMSPEDAIWTLQNTGATMLVMGNHVLRKKKK
jgi:carbamoyltransferase